jgi:hypothetical protein
METKVIVPGSKSVSATLTAVSGPALMTVIAYATSLFAKAETGPFFCTRRSADGAGTVVFPVDELFSSFGSNVAVDTVAVLLKVEPAGVAGGMFATKVKFAIDPAGKLAMVHVIVPFVPKDGFEQLNAGPLF